MHYYQFNIGDYLKSTLHLSCMEDIAYRRLLDRYYDTENPLETDLVKLCRLIRMSEHKEETQQVLEEFFNLTKKGWIQKRVERELEKYSQRADIARKNGNLGGRPKKTQRVIDKNPEETGLKANHKPLTINQETLNNKGKDLAGKPADHSQIPFTEKNQIQKAEHIVNLLNNRIDTKFTARNPKGDPTANGQMIIMRLKEGYELKDFAVVVNGQILKWGKDGKMAEYLRPKTLFSRQNFENYLGGASELSRM